MKNNQEFSNFRKTVWPIHGYELKKFIPLAVIFFFISLNYSVLRNLKDIFVINSVSAEALSYVKTIGVTPMVVIFTIVYNLLSNKLGRHKLFYATVVYFFAFFAIFTFLLLPNIQRLQLNNFYNAANAVFPRFSHLWGAIRYWVFALFYIHAELWGTFALSVAFWTFANEITNLKQSKRFYSFLALGANIALLFSASFLSIFNNAKSMVVLLYIVLVSTLALLGMYYWFTNQMEADPSAYEIEPKEKKSKPKLSFVESLKFLFSSKYLRYIALLVFSYGFVISLIEAVWKSQIKALQSSQASGIELLAKIYSFEVFLIGITAIILILTSSSWIMSKSWRFAALITPVVASIFGGAFFAFMYLGKTVFVTIFGMSSLLLAVVIGMLQVVFIKAFKYTLFDPTKEAAYIPLDSESKIKGKAAVDGVGGRLGKSGGAILLAGFVIPFIGKGSIERALPVTFLLIGLALLSWVYAVNGLDRELKKLTSEKKDK